METAPLRRRPSKDEPPSFSADMKTLRESFIKSHDGSEKRMREIVDELKTISGKVKVEQKIVLMLRALNNAVIGGIVLMVIAAVAGRTGGAGRALLALIVGVLLAVVAAGAGLLTAFTQTVPRGRAALGTALAAVAAVGAMLVGAAEGTVLPLITAVLLAVVAAGAGVATAAGAAREEARKVILALRAAASGRGVGDDAFKILGGALAVVSAVAVVLVVATAVGAVLALVVGADLAVGAVSGLAGTMGAIIAIVGVTALVADAVLRSFIEEGGADQVEHLLNELKQNVEPLKKNLEDMKNTLEKIALISGQKSQLKEVITAPLSSAKAFIQTITDMVEILNAIRAGTSPAAEEKLRKSIMESAEQSQKVIDSFKKIKLELKQDEPVKQHQSSELV